MNGIINVLKPSGMTSHDVVSFIRRTLNIKKVGHTGTLDPNAAGVLPICVGKATRVSQYLMEKKKEYRGELTLGKKTDTQDKYGQILEEKEVIINDDTIHNVFYNYRGDIFQIPPMYSAIKIKGKKLYELAREGKEIKRDPRRVHIYNLNIISIVDKRILFDVECSRGTYVRTLCNDIGRDIGTLGYMSFLIRTRVGKFNIENSFTLEDITFLTKENKINKFMLPIDYALDHFNRLDLEDKFYDIIINGGRLNIDNVDLKNTKISIDNNLRVYCKNNFIGIGKVMEKNNSKIIKMDKVLI